MKSNSATQPARVTRGVHHARSYGPLLRLADRLAGIRDREIVADSSGEMPLTPLVVKLQATFDENDRRILAHTQDTCRQAARRLSELTADVERVDAVIATVRAELDAIKEPSADKLSARNGGELHLDAFAVTTRRRREHDGRTATLAATLKQLQDDREARLVECGHHAAQLVEEFELSRTISERLRHFYNRRLANYARAARINGTATPRISEPSWTTTHSCPWIPGNLEPSSQAH